MRILVVPTQGTRIAVGLVAELASMWLLRSMRQLVTIQMILTLKGLLADMADVLPLIAMRQLMLGDGAGVAEHL